MKPLLVVIVIAACAGCSAEPPPEEVAATIALWKSIYPDCEFFLDESGRAIDAKCPDK